MGILLDRCSIEPPDAVFPGCRVESWLAVELLLHGSRFPVHRARVVRERFAAWPIDAFIVEALLADNAGVTGSGNRDASKAVRTDGFGSCLQNRHRIDIAGSELLRCHRADDNNQSERNPEF